MHFILDIGIQRLSITLKKKLCDVIKKRKSEVQDWYIKNITKQKPRYLLSINIESGAENIGSRYIKLNQKLCYSQSIKLKA